MSKILWGPSYKVYSAFLPKFKASELSVLILGRPPFYTSTLLVFCDNIKFWSIAKHVKCGLISETQKASIALNYCYSLISLNGSLPKINLK